MARLLSIETVATLTEVSAKTIQRWVAAGEFPGPVYLPNGKARWHSAVVKMWLSGRPSVAPVKEKILGQERTGLDRDGQIERPESKQKKPV